MNVYVETNFILELAFLQEQHKSCDRIIAESEAKRISLVIAAFCIAESYETLIHRAKKRLQIKDDLDRELKQLGRSKPYEDRIDALRDIAGLLIRSNSEEDRRLPGILNRILAIADVIPLDADVIVGAVSCSDKLEQQDALVYSSVLHHLSAADGSESCFISRDRAGFDDPDIRDNLTSKGCKMLFSFVDGCKYIEHCLGTGRSG